MKQPTYHVLMGSLCVWLFCAWIVQQPTPLRKAPDKPVSAQTPAVSSSLTTPDTVPLDPESGLALGPNLTLVKGQCLACHSSKLIRQSHFDREKWIERIRWMQQTQKLWDLGESEGAVLTYLTTYYGPVPQPFDGRRLPLNPPGWSKRPTDR